MSFQLNTRSINNLKGVKPELVTLMKAAIVDSPYEFVITQGLRTLEEQKVLFKLGKSKTMKSRHLTGDAVDIAVRIDGEVTWDLKYYKQVATHVKKVAKGLGIRITWGGDWVSFIDGPHFQLEP